MRKALLFTLLFILVALLSVQLVSADRALCDSRVNDTQEKLLECVTVAGAREHQAAFQAIADANGGNRAAGTPGYDASVAYVVETLQAAGYEVELNGFNTTFAPPAALQQTAPLIFIDVDPSMEIMGVNVLAELPGEEDGRVVMVGAHLDSVNAGPGINDNGSGSAAILETAVQMSKVKPRNTVRFAWWGAEELGLVGSTAYVNGLTPAEQDDIALYLNFDMIGSPNHVFFIYDGDNSDGEGAGPGPEGSAEIEKLFESYYTELGLPFKGTGFSGRSDYRPFIEVGIPAGGLFTGAGGVKTPEEAALWGGTANVQYDPCYHRACDTFDNINLEAYDVNTDAVAFSTLHYAMSTGSLDSFIPLLLRP